jgi:type II secretory pathway pseudopilin PulG
MQIDWPAPRQAGLTLVELALVFVVLALLLGGLLVPLAMQIEQQRIRETQKAMEEIKEALIGFAIVNGRLPCPATLASNGVENARRGADPVTEGCSGGVYEGLVPWTTLGIKNVDAWSRIFRYRVSNEFTRKTGDVTASGGCLPVPPGSDNSCTLELGDAGTMSVVTRGDNPATTGMVESKALITLSSNIPAMIVSHGGNGFGATSELGIAQAAPPVAHVDEADNGNGANSQFVSRVPAPSQAGCSDVTEGLPLCEFDDLVAWLSPNILFNRMVAAGRLP